jgi:putative phage-type endonuclease
MGVCPFKTPLQVWAAKQGIEADSNGSAEAMEWGHRLEQPISEAVAERLGQPVRRWDQDLLFIHPTRTWQACTPDAFIGDDQSQLLEIKTTSSYRASDWEDSIPINYQVQVQHQLAVTGAKVAYVACLIGGQKLVIYKAEPMPEFIAHLCAREEAFWRNCQEGIEPEAGPGQLDRAILGKLYQEREEPLAFADGPVCQQAIEIDQSLEELKEQIKQLNQSKERLENQLLQLMAGHESAVLPSGVKYSYRWQTRKAYAVEEGRYRVLRRSGK